MVSAAGYSTAEDVGCSSKVGEWRDERWAVYYWMMLIMIFAVVAKSGCQQQMEDRDKRSSSRPNNKSA